MNQQNSLNVQIVMYVVKVTVSSCAPTLIVLIAMCVLVTLAIDLMIMGTLAMVE